MPVVLAIDPGKEKCGLAVVSARSGVLFQNVVATCDLLHHTASLIEKFEPDRVIIGSGTNSKPLRKQLAGKPLGLSLTVVDEKHSTELARSKYFAANPPKGIWKMVPLGLQVPPEPYDDYAAIVLAEQFLAAGE